jgi:hypothetical protein
MERRVAAGHRVAVHVGRVVQHGIGMALLRSRQRACAATGTISIPVAGAVAQYSQKYRHAVKMPGVRPPSVSIRTSPPPPSEPGASVQILRVLARRRRFRRRFRGGSSNAAADVPAASASAAASSECEAPTRAPFSSSTKSLPQCSSSSAESISAAGPVPWMFPGSSAGRPARHRSRPQPLQRWMALNREVNGDVSLSKHRI